MAENRPRPRVPGSPNLLAKRSRIDPIMDRMRYVIPPSLAEGADKARSRLSHEMRSAAASRMKKGAHDGSE